MEKTSNQPLSARSREAHGFQLKSSQSVKNCAPEVKSTSTSWVLTCRMWVMSEHMELLKKGRTIMDWWKRHHCFFLRAPGLFPSCATPCGVVGLRGQSPPCALALSSDTLFLGSLENSQICLILSHRKTLDWQKKDQKSSSLFLYVLNGRWKFAIGVS